MNSDQVAVRHTVNGPWRDRDAGDTDRANHRTLSVRHEHIHARRRYGRVDPLQIHVRNFNAEGIQPGTRACLAKREPGEPAIEIATQGNKPRWPILFGERASTHKGKKRCIDGDPLRMAGAHNHQALLRKQRKRCYPLRSDGPRRAGPSEAGSDRQHFSGCDLVDRTDHLQLSAGDEIGQDRLRAQERLDVEPHVLGGGLGEEIGGDSSACAATTAGRMALIRLGR